MQNSEHTLLLLLVPKIKLDLALRLVDCSACLSRYSICGECYQYSLSSRVFFSRNICVCVLTRVDVSAYEELLTRLKDIDLIRQIGSLLSWDQEVLMPPKAAPLRAEQLAWISKTAHERLTDVRIGEILDEIESNDDMDAITSANIRLCLLYTSPSPRDRQKSRMPSSA